MQSVLSGLIKKSRQKKKKSLSLYSTRTRWSLLRLQEAAATVMMKALCSQHESHTYTSYPVIIRQVITQLP